MNQTNLPAKCKITRTELPRHPKHTLPEVEYLLFIMNGVPVVQGTKAKRQATSCAECKRRKQKVPCHAYPQLGFIIQVYQVVGLTRGQCNREWPCHHCQMRKVPHLCHFVSSTTSLDDVQATAGDQWV